MTLIVGAEDKIFADDLVISRASNEFTDNDVIVRMCKLFVDKHKRVAVGVLGNVVNDDEVSGIIVQIIADMILRYELRIKSPTIPAKTVSLITDYGNRSFFVMTKKNYYHIDDKLAINTCSDLIEHPHGSGAIGYTMARVMGYSVEDSYSLVSDTINTVGKLSHMVSRSELKPIVLTKALAKLKEKLDV